MRSLLFLLCTLACLLLNSCFDVREEIWIKADGSGRAELEYVVPSGTFGLVGGESGLREKVQELIDSEPDLHLEELTITSHAGDTTITLKASTDSMVSLIGMQENEIIKTLPESALGFGGEFDVKLEGLAVSFDRRIDLQKALGLASLAISGNQRRQRNLNYTIHLPNKPKTHNATGTGDNGRTLIWEYTLGEALSKPISTNFLVKIPLPWWAYAGAALIAALIIFGGIKAWRRLRTRQTQGLERGL